MNASKGFPLWDLRHAYQFQTADLQIFNYILYIIAFLFIGSFWGQLTTPHLIEYLELNPEIKAKIQELLPQFDLEQLKNGWLINVD